MLCHAGRQGDVFCKQQTGEGGEKRISWGYFQISAAMGIASNYVLVKSEIHRYPLLLGMDNCLK